MRILKLNVSPHKLAIRSRPANSCGSSPSSQLLEPLLRQPTHLAPSRFCPIAIIIPSPSLLHSLRSRHRQASTAQRTRCVHQSARLPHKNDQNSLKITLVLHQHELLAPRPASEAGSGIWGAARRATSTAPELAAFQAPLAQSASQSLDPGTRSSSNGSSARWRCAH